MLNTPSNQENCKSPVKHIIMCWLKQDANRKEFIETIKSLKKITQVQSLSIGTKLPSIEPVADNSFDLAFIMSFNSKEDLQIYLDHSVHTKAVKSIIKPALSKVIVYDFQEV